MDNLGSFWSSSRNSKKLVETFGGDRGESDLDNAGFPRCMWPGLHVPTLARANGHTEEPRREQRPGWRTREREREKQVPQEDLAV